MPSSAAFSMASISLAGGVGACFAMSEHLVIAGLDPAIHPLRDMLPSK
jgi:hypothetical protein